MGDELGNQKWIFLLNNRVYIQPNLNFWSTGMISSSSTLRPHTGRVIRDLFSLLNAVFGIVQNY